MYILFTSGSTGKPKGVQLSHRALSDRLEGLRGWLEGEAGPVLCVTNVTFDIFFSETLLALALGYPVVLADEEEMLLPWRLAALITRHRPRIAQFTPSRLQMYLRSEDFANAVKEFYFTILVGESVSPGLVSEFKGRCAGRLVNMYGPTEAAVYVTAGELAVEEPVTIGTPLNNCRIYVLDPAGRPVLPTALGELYLAGPGLADGYVGRPDLTAELFLPDPFFPGERMYRSGDVGRLRADGRLECLGRTDSQVKINGNRVELGEVADALRQAGAHEAAALTLQNADGSTTLCGIVTPNTLAPAALRQSLALRLPAYMIPGQLLTLAAMPYNASGKIDLPALKALARQEEGCAHDPGGGTADLPAAEPAPQPISQPAPQPAPPAGAVSAETLLDIWKQVLGQPALCPELSLFEQGGSSLTALNILSEYYNRGITMTLAEFYRAPTVGAQAELLGRRTGAPSVPEQDRAEQPAGVPPLRAGQEGPYRTVLLTGATGFLGAHLLRELLDAGCERVICLLRDGDGDRLLATLTWYFGSGWIAPRKGRIEVCRGDVCRTEFGMSRAEYDDLARRADAIYHAAADVRHYAADDRLVATNLEGARQAVAFARAGECALIHISTASICGTRAGADLSVPHAFTEDDLDIGQDWQENLYIRGKFLAEREICNAVEEGLTARIFRIGRLIGRRSDGVFQKNPESNAFYRVAGGVGLIGALPESLAGVPLELSPVDLCARSIVALDHAQRTALHVLQPHPAPLGRTMSALFPGLEILPDRTFSLRLSQASAEHGEALSSLIDLWNGARLGGGNVSVSCQITGELLRQTGAAWPEDDLGHAMDLFGTQR